MRTLEPYIESIKAKFRLKTYPETMMYIGMHKQAWTAIQKGAGVGEKNAIRIAKALNKDPAEIMAVSMALKAKNTESRNLWLRIAKDYEISEFLVNNRQSIKTISLKTSNKKAVVN